MALETLSAPVIIVFSAACPDLNELLPSLFKGICRAPASTAALFCMDLMLVLAEVIITFPVICILPNTFGSTAWKAEDLTKPLVFVVDNQGWNIRYSLDLLRNRVLEWL